LIFWSTGAERDVVMDTIYKSEENKIKELLNYVIG
jgi:hypothetical protein